jgi:hypothetical protein
MSMEIKKSVDKKPGLCYTLIIKREENRKMKKEVRTITIDYTYDTAHKGTNYTLDGQHWMNGGEFAEVITKSVLGYEAKKDANTSYDIASDIEELNASVKSSRFTLVNKVLADTFDETVNKYFETVHSTVWIYTVVMEETATLYYMTAEEFREYLYKFTALNERNVIRAKATSGKMIAWFESKLN